MDTLKGKMPPDSSKEPGRLETRASLTRQATPMPSGEPKLARRPRPKFIETPIEAVVTYGEKGNHVSKTTTKTTVNSTTKSEAQRKSVSQLHTEIKDVNQRVESNGWATPTATRETTSDENSPSLWLNKTPEEIVDFYRQLGPNWRNEFPKTDVAYSPGSPWYNKEVVPGSGIPVITNMSREPVGMYLRDLKHRRSFNAHTDTSESRFHQSHQTQQSSRVSLKYGLNHSPSTPLTRLSWPSHEYSQYSSNYSSSTSSRMISRARSIITSTVSMITRLFALLVTVMRLVWHSQRNHDNTASQGVDTVDSGYHLRQRTVQYEYKTGAKKSNLHHRAPQPSSLSNWFHSLSSQIFRSVSWMIQDNSWIFWIKDKNTESVVLNRKRNFVKFALLAIVILLFGFWLLSLTDDSLAVKASTKASQPLPIASENAQPLTSDHTQFIKRSLSSARGVILESMASSFNTTNNAIHAAGNFIATPFTTPMQSLSHFAVYFKSPYSTVVNVVTSIYHYVCLPFTTSSEILAQCAQYVGGTTYELWELCTGLVYVIWSSFFSTVHFLWSVVFGGVSTVVMTGGAMVTSFKSVGSQTKNPFTPMITNKEEARQQTQTASPIAQGPSVEEIVLKVLSDVRFAAMIEQNVKDKVEISGDKTRKESAEREKELQDKVTELCTRLVESEIIKYKASVAEERDNREEQMQQSTTPATVSVADNEDLQRYKLQVEDLISSIKLLESETQTSFLDLMGKFSGVVDDKIRAALAVYDADKTALTDYALESAGGAVVNIRCTETYTVKDPYYVLFGYALFRRDSSPRKAIQPGLLPGDCWPFQGSVGCLVIKLSHRIKITKFSMEHIPRALTPSGEIDSAPNKFTVWGLRQNNDDNPTFLGEFAYDQHGPTLQFFDAQVSPESFELVELKILSNHGNIEYTCLYRFRVHGSLAPPTSNHEAGYHFTGNHNTYRHHVAQTHSKYNPV